MRSLPDSAAALEAMLESLCPGFASTLEPDRFDAERGERTLHAVMMDFAPYLSSVALALPPARIDHIGAFLHAALLADGALGNAVDTCLVEHAKQLKLNKLLGKWLKR